MSELLLPMDIELIYQLKNKNLRPETKEQLMECIKVLDGYKEVYEKIFSHIPDIHTTLYNYYKQQSQSRITMILNYI